MRGLEPLGDWSQKALETVTNNTVAQGQRLTTWLMVGNAGALAFSFNAMVQGTGCAPGVLQRATLAFAIGLAAAFAGSVISYAGGIRSVVDVTKVHAAVMSAVHWDGEVRAALAAGAHLTEEHPLIQNLANAQRKVEARTVSKVVWASAGIAMALMLVAASSFAWGATEPLRLDDAGFRACAAGKPDRALPAAVQKATQNASGTPAVK